MGGPLFGNKLIKAGVLLTWGVLGGHHGFTEAHPLQWIVTGVARAWGGSSPILYVGVPLGDRKPHPSIRRVTAKILTLF